MLYGTLKCHKAITIFHSHQSIISHRIAPGKLGNSVPVAAMKVPDKHYKESVIMQSRLFVTIFCLKSTTEHPLPMAAQPLPVLPGLKKMRAWRPLSNATVLLGSLLRSHHTHQLSLEQTPHQGGNGNSCNYVTQLERSRARERY